MHLPLGFKYTDQCINVPQAPSSRQQHPIHRSPLAAAAHPARPLAAITANLLHARRILLGVAITALEAINPPPKVKRRRASAHHFEADHRKSAAQAIAFLISGENIQAGEYDEE